MSTINVKVTFGLTGGFTYDGTGVGTDGKVTVTEPSKIIYTLQNAEELTFLRPLLSVTEPSTSTPLDITKTVISGKTMTLTDTHANIETVCMQLRVEVSDGSIILSPDPKIADTDPQ